MWLYIYNDSPCASACAQGMEGARKGDIRKGEVWLYIYNGAYDSLRFCLRSGDGGSKKGWRERLWGRCCPLDGAVAAWGKSDSWLGIRASELAPVTLWVIMWSMLTRMDDNRSDNSSSSGVMPCVEASVSRFASPCNEGSKRRRSYSRRCWIWVAIAEWCWICRLFWATLTASKDESENHRMWLNPVPVTEWWQDPTIWVLLEWVVR